MKIEVAGNRYQTAFFIEAGARDPQSPVEAPGVWGVVDVAAPSPNSEANRIPKPMYTCLPQLVFYNSSSVQTLKLTRVFGPKVCVIATSAASRPWAIRTRPIRGMLLRASKVYQWPPR
jgi:hypothetical protein